MTGSAESQMIRFTEKQHEELKKFQKKHDASGGSEGYLTYSQISLISNIWKDMNKKKYTLHDEMRYAIFYDKIRNLDPEDKDSDDYEMEELISERKAEFLIAKSYDRRNKPRSYREDAGTKIMAFAGLRFDLLGLWNSSPYPMHCIQSPKPLASRCEEFMTSIGGKVIELQGNDVGSFRMDSWALEAFFYAYLTVNLALDETEREMNLLEKRVKRQETIIRAREDVIVFAEKEAKKVGELHKKVLAEKNAEISKKEKRIEELTASHKSEIQKLTSKLADVEADLEKKTDDDALVRQVKESLAEKDRMISKHKDWIERGLKTVGNRNRKIEELEDEIKGITTDKESLQAKLKTALSERDELKQMLNAANSHSRFHEKKKKKKNDLQKENDGLKEQLAGLNLRLKLLGTRPRFEDSTGQTERASR